ncbi:hypothetical protein [Kitasatospora sp. NPDC059599]|uniref:hypothetical protein n=1 Tax=Kitasatospora sp. NPDC059599 TaxID=3346880 RepID=UPI0036B0EB19
MVKAEASAYRGLILDFFGVLTVNMVEMISSFEDREGLARGTFLRAWADPRGQDPFRQLELARISQIDWNNGFAAQLGVAPEPRLPSGRTRTSSPFCRPRPPDGGPLELE